MIFRIKHSWYLALLATAVVAAASWSLGGWRDLTGGPLALPWQIAVGVGGALSAMAVNGGLHELCSRIGKDAYRGAFEDYRREILDRMQWREYLAGGIMAAVAEEPLFRGLLLRTFDQPALGVAVAAGVFAACHWLRPRYFGFWLWALWEGVLFGILFVTTGSLLVPMIAHGLHDVAAYMVLGSARLSQDQGEKKI